MMASLAIDKEQARTFSRLDDVAPSNGAAVILSRSGHLCRPITSPAASPSQDVFPRIPQLTWALGFSRLSQLSTLPNQFSKVGLRQLRRTFNVT
jgi:hypothetical protein